MRTSLDVLPIVGTKFVQPTPSKNRSKRLWKKLRRRTAEPLYGAPVVLSIPSSVLARVTSTNIPSTTATTRRGDAECSQCRLGNDDR